MSSLQPYLIAGSDVGLETDKKSFLLPDKAFPKIENAYVWRDRVRKREGLKLIGRLRRVLTSETASVTTPAADTITIDNIYAYLDLTRVAGLIGGITQASLGKVTTTTNHNLVTGDQVTLNNVSGMTEVNGNTYTITVTGVNTFTLGVNTTLFTAYTSGGDWTIQSNAEIEPDSLDITVGAPDTSTFTDDGNGSFAVTGLGLAAGSYINYSSGKVVLKFTGVLTGGATVTANINYFPTLPVMGIMQRERASINLEQTMIFDTMYCYIFDGSNYIEYLSVTNTTWNGSNYNFFWGANYRGSDPSVRELFVTNFKNDAESPMRYTDGSSWVDFEPALSGNLVRNESLGTYTAGSGSFGPVIPANIPLVPGTVTVTISNGTDPDTIFTDLTGSGSLTGSPSTSSGTINYTTGSINLSTVNPTMPGPPDGAVTVNYQYESSYMFSAKILIPYYGRLIAFNTFEGLTRGTAKQYYNRCRFSQIGDPTQGNAWISTIFGKGGFIDAPTNEAIISAIFYKNTLIVYFERSTWQLRYQGEYGIPFIWERISSDLGSESTFSSVLFDEGVLGVGNRAIVSANAQSVQRIDSKIPDIVFSFRNENQGKIRTHGIRDYKKEIVYWCFNDSTDTSSETVFPNKLLVYNYRNDSWAIFRSSVTAFGRYYSSNAITWDRTDIFWDDYNVFWNDPDGQTEFPFVICGNHQGQIHFLGYHTKDESSLTIESIDRTVSTVQLTIPNHNLINGDIIYLEGLDYIDTSDSSDVTTDINDQTYKVNNLVPYDANVIEIAKWDSTYKQYVSNFSYTPASGTGTYIGKGKVTLLPRMNIITKDFNPFVQEGKQVKLGYIDFLTDEISNGVVNINLFADTTIKESGNLLIGQTEVQLQSNPLFATQNSDITWNRFFSTLFGQFIAAQITYDDDQMNDRSIIDEPFILSALILWVKAGGRIAP